jgi:hypothetical protein
MISSFFQYQKKVFAKKYFFGKGYSFLISKSRNFQYLLGVCHNKQPSRCGFFKELFNKNPHG